MRWSRAVWYPVFIRATVLYVLYCKVHYSSVQYRDGARVGTLPTVGMYSTTERYLLLSMWNLGLQGNFASKLCDDQFKRQIFSASQAAHYSPARGPPKWARQPVSTHARQGLTRSGCPKTFHHQDPTADQKTRHAPLCSPLLWPAARTATLEGLPLPRPQTRICFACPFRGTVHPPHRFACVHLTIHGCFRRCTRRKPSPASFIRFLSCVYASRSALPMTPAMVH